MANKRPRDLTSIGTPNGADVLPVDDVSEATAVEVKKVAVSEFLARANHTGTQTKSTISDFPAVVPQAEAEAGTATTERIWTAQRVKQAIAALESGSASITFTDVVHCVMETPQGTVAFPDVHTLATAGAKKDGFVLPDGASSSTINFSCRVPKDLAATPAMKIRVYIMTLGAVAGPADVRLTVKTTGRADTESLDVALTAESETTVTMPTATETIDIYEQDLTTDWAADDYVIGQISRDPTDAADDFTDDIMIIGIDLLVDRTIS